MNIGAIGIGTIATAALVAAIVLAVRLLRQQPAGAGAFRPLSFAGAAAQPPAAWEQVQPALAAPPRLAASLISPRAPSRLRFPVRPTLGRILELSLPLRLDWTGDYPLERVELRVLLPNALTFGPSLERMVAEAPSALPGAAARYASGQTHTLVTVAAPAVPPGTKAALTVPISVKSGEAGEHPVQITLSCPALGQKERRYRLELIETPDEAGLAALELSVPDAWTCLPDEESRLTDPDQPLDRLASTHFAIVEPRSI